MRGITLPTTLYFSDRPQRVIGRMTTADFVDVWATGDNGFESDPPNAVVAFLEPGADVPDEAAVGLKAPNLDGAGDLLLDPGTRWNGSDADGPRSRCSSTRSGDRSRPSPSAKCAGASGDECGDNDSELDRHTKGDTMTSMTSVSDIPVVLYIAAYSDPDAAQEDWDDIKELAKEKVITVEALVLVSRDADGKIHEQDNAHTVAVGGVLGAAGGLLVGLIFPPALLVSTAVGVGVGASVGGLVSHHEKKEIKAEVANDLPFGSSGIVVLLEERWLADAEKALSKPDNVSKHEVDRQSVEHAKTEASKPTLTSVS